MDEPRDIASLLSAAAQESPDRIALIEEAGRTLTWADLDHEVSRIAAGLGAAGIVAGHRVMLATGNRLEFVTTYLGVLRAQAVAVPVNPRSTPSELARMIADSGARMLVADPDTVQTGREAVRLLDEVDPADYPDVDQSIFERARMVRLVAIGTTLQPGERSYDQLRADSPRPIPTLPDSEKLAALLYTSGTSGRPRAAMLSHRALIANVVQAAEVDPPMIRRDDVVLGVLPLFHVYGLGAVLGGVLWHRATLVLAPRFEPLATLDLIARTSCTVLPVAPPVFAHWRGVEDLAERLGSVRLVLSGSAPLEPAVIEEFVERTGVPVHQGYGLTEASPVVTSTLRSASARPGSVGAALDGVEIRLVDDSGAPAEGEDPGEIQIRGDNLFSGYWPGGADGPDGDGWWSTGDVGYLDDHADLVLVDRVKELILVSGFNVYPGEVEDVVREVETVAACAVIGADDPQSGEQVVAYVVKAAGVGDEAVVEAVRNRCAERLAGYKRPSRIELVDELPVTVTGKVAKGRLRQLERRRAVDLID